MDEREKKAALARKARQQSAQNKRPGGKGPEESEEQIIRQESRRNAGNGPRPEGKTATKRPRPAEGSRPNRRPPESDGLQSANQRASRTRRLADGARRRPDRPEQARPVRPGGRPEQKKKKSNRSKRRKRNIFLRVLIIIVLLMIAAAGLLFWRRYGSSSEKADLNKYYGIEKADDLAVVVNNQLMGALPDHHAGGKMFDGVPYVEYKVVRDYINSWFYWDYNENVLIYTLPTGSVTVGVGNSEYTDIKERKSEEYVILKTEGRTAYIALPFIQKYTNMEYRLYESEEDGVPARAVIDCDWGEHTFATVKRDTPVRYQGGVKSPVLAEAKKSSRVRVLEDEDGWKKVRTEDGYIGYVKTNSLKRIKTETTSREFVEPEYTSISAGHTINMAWHNVDNAVANSYVLETIASTKGLTTIAPTWFSIADTEGNISSIATAEYVNYAHQSNLEVWGVLRDFHGGINSFEETMEVLSYTSKRDNLINQVIGSALQVGLDGINLDFELISLECGEHYIQFVRELSVKCRQNGLVFSIDNYVPMPYNEHYRLDEQAKTADYVVIMGYDEHNASSYEAGSVASYSYVKKGIKDALEVVPNTKLINAIPLYTRLWFEEPKTKEQLASEAGTEAADHRFNVSSTAMGMEEAEQLVIDMGAVTEWNEDAKQNYAEWEADGGTYKIWLEDEQSLEEKLKLIKENQLAGVASWRLGWEEPGIWDLILQYVN